MTFYYFITGKGKRLSHDFFNENLAKRNKDYSQQQGKQSVLNIVLELLDTHISGKNIKRKTTDLFPHRFVNWKILLVK